MKKLSLIKMSETLPVLDPEVLSAIKGGEFTLTMNGHTYYIDKDSSGKWHNYGETTPTVTDYVPSNLGQFTKEHFAELKSFSISNGMNAYYAEALFSEPARWTCKVVGGVFGFLEFSGSQPYGNPYSDPLKATAFQSLKNGVTTGSWAP